MWCLEKTFVSWQNQLRLLAYIHSTKRKYSKPKAPKSSKCLIKKKVTFLLLKGYTLNDMGLLLPIKGSQWKISEGSCFIYN